MSYRPAPGGDELDGSVNPEVSQHLKEEDHASGELGSTFFLARSMGLPEIIRKPFQNRVEDKLRMPIEIKHYLGEGRDLLLTVGRLDVVYSHTTVRATR